MNKLFTIGFTKKSLEQFLELLKKNKISVVIDIRLNNTSQLAGFAKADDLRYILEEFSGIKYQHITEFAPSKKIFDDYKKNKNWKKYEKAYKNLILQRKLKSKLLTLASIHKNICFLCSETESEHCHRRLLAEYLKGLKPSIKIIHL
ncbi:MAG: DUF488 domain-containing protein [Nanoarchaeota archaeon]